MMRSAMVLALAVVASGAAHATVIFTPGNNPQPGEQNIFFGATETGTSISGATKGGTTVTFSSTTNTLFQKAKGQAMITDASGGDIFDITVTPSVSITDLIVDLNKAPKRSSVAISVVASDGTFLDTLATGPGSNFITITTTDGETISSVNFSTDKGFEQFKQPRISGVSTPTPEPASVALLGAGLLGLLVAHRRKAR